jgi:hypothetical protein
MNVRCTIDAGEPPRQVGCFSDKQCDECLRFFFLAEDEVARTRVKARALWSHDANHAASSPSCTTACDLFERQLLAEHALLSVGALVTSGARRVAHTPPGAAVGTSRFEDSRSADPNRTQYCEPSLARLSLSGPSTRLLSHPLDRDCVPGERRNRRPNHTMGVIGACSATTFWLAFGQCAGLIDRTVWILD